MRLLELGAFGLGLLPPCSSLDFLLLEALLQIKKPITSNTTNIIVNSITKILISNSYRFTVAGVPRSITLISIPD
jgi:hypothetical protein